jgi:uncharacterized caspase-like protein
MCERSLTLPGTGIGTLIAFATQPGNVALDGEGENSPFTTALLEHIEAPGEDIAVILRRVRQDVIDKTDGRQVPWENSSLTGSVVLREAANPSDTATTPESLEAELDSLFKCDTEVVSECLDGRLEAEAFSRG